YRDSDGVIDRTIDSHVRRVRRKFAEVGGDPVETVHGIGYRLSPCDGGPKERGAGVPRAKREGCGGVGPVRVDHALAALATHRQARLPVMRALMSLLELSPPH